MCSITANVFTEQVRGKAFLMLVLAGFSPHIGVCGVMPCVCMRPACALSPRGLGARVRAVPPTPPTFTASQVGHREVRQAVLEQVQPQDVKEHNIGTLAYVKGVQWQRALL